MFPEPALPERHRGQPFPPLAHVLRQAGRPLTVTEAVAGLEAVGVYKTAHEVREAFRQLAQRGLAEKLPIHPLTYLWRGQP